MDHISHLNRNPSTPWERALQIPKLFDTILSFFPPSLLLKARLLNSTWLHASNHLLLQEALLTINLTYDSKKRSFTFHKSTSTTTNQNPLQLTSLNSLIQSSPEFPCKSFSFTVANTNEADSKQNGGGLISPDAQTFFEVYGPNIIHLELDLFGHQDSCGPHVTTVAIIRKLLLQQAPNIESLRLTSLPAQWNGNKESLLGDEKLPKMKLLGYSLEHCDHESYSAHTAIVTELLAAATNLETYDRNTSIESDHLDIILRNGKIKVIKKFDLFTDPHPWRCYFNVTQKLLRARPALELLSVFSTDPRPNFQLNHTTMHQVTSTLTKLLQSSQDSLTHFVCYGHIGELPEFQMPRLERVKTIDFLITCSRPESLMPLGFQFSNVPALENVSFSAAVGWSIQRVLQSNADKLQSLWSMYFWDVGLGIGVKKLGVLFQLPELWMNGLVGLFPNVEELDLKNVTCFSCISDCVWGAGSLKRILINFDAGSDGNTFPKLDAAFCGFSEVSCRKLLFQSGSIKMDKVRRVHPSILNLRALEKLRLEFHDENQEEKQSYNLLTTISTEFAFEQMARVRISVGVTAKNLANRKMLWTALEPLGIPMETL